MKKCAIALEQKMKDVSNLTGKGIGVAVIDTGERVIILSS